ncbi:UNVERIFIED_ORG: putative DNA-binding transcriptional regulator YafY [Methylobacterium sp. SuP10 SLI 274]|uniref:helix-turn-helix transcriptional regulator n=1 Tax=Methylorubrum extorquens TaxID=408 RepID=UPI00209EFD38|nr:YafY family protein [Methylorubrum extorquens]MCP1559836.1 putative DNA-binding transcriptional regulator YafY [Methylorubrum extorquens]MDH6638755.1 putative DNA-binding transcriptional regulator YafY [Methylobacterium sp. SuP10 SLI 274]
MARTDRLFRLLHAMRVLPSPVTAARLAEETGVSLRSLYRDIDSLRAAGARIDGERGYGYRLIEDVALPQQTFDRTEIEALVLGLAEVRHMGDPALAQAAASALAKVAATLPDRAEQHLLHAVSQVRRSEARFSKIPDMETIRAACWREEALALRYSDKDGAVTERQILPLSIVYLDSKMTLLAWCCLREAFRMFRLDRIEDVRMAGTSFRPRRVTLLRSYLTELRGRAGPRNEPT